MSNINLNASQESVLKIFSSAEEVYVIPPYQRTYSWGYNDYKQLYDDVTTAFLNNQDYFLGNMVLARGKDSQDRPEVVDGQQRLITLWLIIKVLSLLYPEMSRLNRILESESIKSDSSVCKIDSLVIENNDKEILNMILQFDLPAAEKHYNIYRKNKSNFASSRQGILVALVRLYELFNEFFEHLGESSRKKAFIEFFLDRVFLLPIELKDDTVAEANHSALVIFETLNNRGLNLADADIFKAELYRMAASANRQKEFLDAWQDIRNACDTLHMSLDDLFRYYSHIVRAKEGITSSETSLRDFFMSNSVSPLKTASYDTIITDLHRILSYVTRLREVARIRVDGFEEHGKWLQVLFAYTNIYPRFALVCYVYFNGLTPGDPFLDFLKSLVRYYYQTGSAVSNVKYETYSINKRTALRHFQNDYRVPDGMGEYLIPSGATGRLTPGLTLLAHYASGATFMEKYYTNKLLVNRDLDTLAIDFSEYGNSNLGYILENNYISDRNMAGMNLDGRMEDFCRANNMDAITVEADEYFIGDILNSRKLKMRAVLADFFEGKV